MKRRPAIEPSDDELRLFREAVGDAQPLRQDRIHHEPAAAPPVPRQSRSDERAALSESLDAPISVELLLEGGEELAFLRPGLARTVLKDLRRGRWVAQDQIDLHGCNRAEAKALMAGFLDECLKRGLRCVRIIHGKGLRSPGREPVLKAVAANWLAQRSEVLAFCQARAADGGSGAVVVLLKAAKN